MANPPLELVIGENYESETVRIDGKHFVECKFTNCTLVYSGPDFAMGSCWLAPGTIWTFEGQASAMMQALSECGWRFEFGGGSTKAVEVVQFPKDAL